MSMVEAVTESINAGLANGSIDSKKHAAPIEALQKIALYIDSPDFDFGKDNVTFPTLLKYMTALGFTTPSPERIEVKVSKTNKLKDKFANMDKNTNAEG